MIRLFINIIFYPLVFTCNLFEFLFKAFFQLIIKLIKKITYHIHLFIIKKKADNLDQELKNLQSDINTFEKQVDNYIQRNTDLSDISFIDNMDGLEFEEYTCKLLRKNGFDNVIKTKASGDFGIDVLAEKSGIKYAIQCKNYNSPLSNKCVQEAYSGKQYYNCHVGVVLTNSTFTQHARDLADKNGILLWDRSHLIKMLEK